MPPEKDDAPTLGDIESGSIADDLRASFAEAEKEAAAEPSGDARSEGEGGGEPEKAEAAQDERARDDKGRFVAKEGDKPEKPEQEAKPEGELPSQPAAEQPPAEEPEPLDPPVDWSVDEQKAFRALPPAQQKFILDRVGGFTEKLTEAEKSGTRYKALDEVLTPYRQKWARDGFEDVAVIRQLLALTDYAREQPLKFIQEFAQSKGIDLAQLAPRQEQPAADDPYANDPLVQRMNEARAQDRQVIQQLQQQLQTLSGSIQSRQQQEAQAQHQRLDGEINAFATETDDKGKLKHPYFQQVRSLMSVLVERGDAPDLQSAYDMACHAKPDVRAKIAAAKEYADERDRARKAQEKARAAKQAGSSVSGSPGGRSEPQPTGDLRDELRAALAQHSGTPVIQ